MSGEMFNTTDPSSTTGSPAPTSSPIPRTTLHSTSAMATAEPIDPLVIALGVTTGFFLVTTVLCSILVVVLCCQKCLKRQSKKEGRFEGSQVSPHWLHTPTPQENLVQSVGTTDFPIWSVKTFGSPAQNENKNETNSTSSLNANNSPPAAAAATAATTPDTNTQTQTRIPARVAPPPPRSKSKKKAKAEAAAAAAAAAGGGTDARVYAVPETSSSYGWFGRKKKQNSSKYKELNLNQVQAPNTYHTPHSQNV